MAFFAMTTTIFIKYGTARSRGIRATAACSILLWIVVFSTNLPLFFGITAGVDYVDRVSCRPYPVGMNSYIYIGCEVVLFGAIPLLITIILPIVSCCNLDAHSLTDIITVNKTLIKFALFLMVGNILCFTSFVIPVLISIFTPRNENILMDEVLLRLANILVHLSLIPSLVLILVYFPPIRRAIKRKICWCCYTSSRSSNIHYNI